jgi:uncharacterized short protein YbdD (DUF466 family)
MSATLASSLNGARNFLKVLRKIIGVPDYDTYVEHLRCAHPDREPMSRKEFENQRMQDRYTTPGSRCC